MYASAGSSACASSFPYLDLIQETMLTTARVDFDADQLVEASSCPSAPHVVCAEYGRRRGELCQACRSLLALWRGEACLFDAYSRRVLYRHGLSRHSKRRVQRVGLELLWRLPEYPAWAARAQRLRLNWGQRLLCSASVHNPCGGLMRLDSVRGLMVELSQAGTDFDIDRLTRDLNSPALYLIMMMTP